MFAVKGWSVSADKLKAETPKKNPASNENGEPTKKSKKRKRPGQAQAIDSSNVADLWDSVIDGKENGEAAESKAGGQPKEKKRKQEKKRQELSQDQDPGEQDGELADVKKKHKKAGHSADSSKLEGKVSLKEKRKAKKAKKAKDAQILQDDNSDGDTSAKVTTPSTTAKASKSSSSKTTLPTTTPAQPKLTPLQAAMREKLISARFRHLNETLYTRPSADSLTLFNDSPEMFTEYHEGFRRQVEVWPENPVTGYITDIRARARVRHQSKHSRNKQQQAEQDAADKLQQQQLEPLPRNRDTNLCTIADLGCGDAALASTLAPQKAKLKLELLSFDLSSPHSLVTKADIANLPLANGTVDVAIFCLALMGTNWVDFIEEAYRVLRWKGELWVAEIKSRFGAPGSAGSKKGAGGKVVDHSVGNRRNKAAATAGAKKEKAAAAAAGDETTLLVEVDGLDDARQQTDVSAFVSVLNKRGFMLAGQDQGRGEEAVDLSNRMFVKMRFIKCAPATKGKNVREEKEERSRFGGNLQTMAKRPKFIEDDVEVVEAAVLKPCVYKLR